MPYTGIIYICTVVDNKNKRKEKIKPFALDF